MLSEQVAESPRNAQAIYPIRVNATERYDSTSLSENVLIAQVYAHFVISAG